jgi:hypothetical protein
MHTHTHTHKTDGDMERTTNKLLDMISTNESTETTPSRPPLQYSLEKLLSASASRNLKQKTKRISTRIPRTIEKNPLMTPPKKEDRRQFSFEERRILMREDRTVTRQIDFDGEKTTTTKTVLIPKKQNEGGYYLSHMSHVLVDVILGYCDWKSLVRVSSLKLLRERAVLDIHWRPIYRNTYGRWKSKHSWLVRKRPPYYVLFARKEIQKMMKGSHSLEMLVPNNVQSRSSSSSSSNLGAVLDFQICGNHDEYIVVSYSGGDTMTWHMNSKYHRPRVVSSMNAKSRFEMTRKDIETKEWKSSLSNLWTNSALMHFKIGSHEDDSNLSFFEESDSFEEIENKEKTEEESDDDEKKVDHWWAQLKSSPQRRREQKKLERKFRRRQKKQTRIHEEEVDVSNIAMNEKTLIDATPLTLPQQTTTTTTTCMVPSSPVLLSNKNKENNNNTLKMKKSTPISIVKSRRKKVSKLKRKQMRLRTRGFCSTSPSTSPPMNDYSFLSRSRRDSRTTIENDDNNNSTTTSDSESSASSDNEQHEIVQVSSSSSRHSTLKKKRHEEGEEELSNKKSNKKKKKKKDKRTKRMEREMKKRNKMKKKQQKFERWKIRRKERSISEESVSSTNSNISRSSDDNEVLDSIHEGPSLISTNEDIVNEGEKKKKKKFTSLLCLSVLCKGSFENRGVSLEQQQQKSPVRSGLSYAIGKKRTKNTSTNSKIVAGT